jgi:hypothetical protein
MFQSYITYTSHGNVSRSLLIAGVPQSLQSAHLPIGHQFNEFVLSDSRIALYYTGAY